MLRSPSPSPFPPLTGIQAEIDSTIERLVALRSWDACTRSLCDDEPRELRALADLAKSAADAFDPLLQRIAYTAGVSSLSGASEHARITFRAIEDDMCAEIRARADKIEDERGGESQETRDRREHSTLNHRQQGI